MVVPLGLSKGPNALMDPLPVIPWMPPPMPLCHTMGNVQASRELE